jgi:tRNA(His) 5'-end guanylyltransferase
MKKIIDDKNIENYKVDGTCVPDGAYIVLHIDGDNFSAVTKECNKPFDEELNASFITTAGLLVTELESLGAYVQFDEMSVILPPESMLLNRNVGKLISKSVGLATHYFGKALKNTRLDGYERPIIFATHVYALPTLEDLVGYLRWRWDDCIKNSVTTILHHLLLQENNTPAKVAKMLENVNQAIRIQMLAQRGIIFEELPFWKKEGTFLFWVEHDRVGFNPIDKEWVMTTNKKKLIPIPLTDWIRW